MQRVTITIDEKGNRTGYCVGEEINCELCAMSKTKNMMVIPRLMMATGCSRQNLIAIDCLKNSRGFCGLEHDRERSAAKSAVGSRCNRLSQSLVSLTLRPFCYVIRFVGKKEIGHTLFPLLDKD